MARYLWRTLRARYRDEVGELLAIRSFIRPGDTVCDIGANKGSYLYWLSRWAHPGRVFAFEPQAPLASYLREVCRAFDLENVQVEAMAVHAKTGSMTLHIPIQSDDWGSPGASLAARLPGREECRGVEVPVVALDDYLDRGYRVRVLKVDVEGAERGVFEGATRILREQAPLLVFECENRHMESGSVLDVFEFLGALGYQGKFVSGRTLHPLSEFSPAVHQRQEGHRFWDSADYINNFVFRKGTA